MTCLSGLLVLDLSRNVAGPLCTMYMADMGAEVIKIERPPRGDEARYHGPPFLKGESTYFLSLNRNKRSCLLDLKSPLGMEALRRLIARADVLINNFRPGVMDRLGLDRETLQRLNPRLITCHITGYGPDGPWAHRPAYDHIIQGVSGLMSVTGSEKAGIFRVGVSMADIVTGLTALGGILAALYARERTGQGDELHVSLLDAVVATLTFQAGYYFATGEAPRPMGNEHPMIAPYGTFATADGRINLAVGNNDMFARLVAVLGLEPLLQDPRFKDNPTRVQHRDVLHQAIAERLLTNTTEYWVERLIANGVACGPVLTIDQVLNHPQVLHQGMRITMEHPRVGAIPGVGSPYKFARHRVRPPKAPPMLGEGMEEVLRKVGFSEEEIEALKGEAVGAAPDTAV